MEKMYPPVPLHCFRKHWLLLDQAKWMRPRTEAKRKKAKIAPNSNLPCNLMMPYVEFGDTMDLFILYVKFYGWSTHAEGFESLKKKTIEIKVETECWMLALRYCLMVLEGVMTPNSDKSVANAGVFQETLYAKARQAVENRTKHDSGHENPYLPGGKKAGLSPITGDPVAAIENTPGPSEVPTPLAQPPKPTPAPVQPNEQPQAEAPATRGRGGAANRSRNRNRARGGRGGNYGGYERRGGYSNNDGYRRRDREASRSPDRRRPD